MNILNQINDIHMKKNLRKAVIPFFMIMIILGSCTTKKSFPELKPFLKKTFTWNFPSLVKELPVHVYYSGDSTDSEGADAIIYIKNKAWERIGQESDLSILTDLINQKFIVLTLDFGMNQNAVSPAIDNDLNELYNAVFGNSKNPSILEDVKLTVKKYRCFVIPEGYRVANNLTFWEIDKHGVYGTLEYIMKTYNDEIVPKVQRLKPAKKPADMADRKGNPFDYRIGMDICYPSQPTRKLPAFVYSETQSTRNSHGGLTNDGSHLNWFQLRGYVYVVLGHCFNPCVTHYWHFINFTLDHWNGLACYSAGIRYLHMNADKYGIDTDYIGVMGISKGQYAVTRLSDPNHASGTESKKFEGFPEGTPEPQPWQGYPSKITAGWQGMGMGLWESEYITPDYVPTILACGEKDRDVITKEGNPRFLKRLEELDLNHIDLFMEGLGHSLSYGWDKRLGVDRYQLVNDFFDRYLKVKDKLPPVVLIIVPRDSAQNIDPASEISVQFAPVIDEKTILENNAVSVTKARDNTEVSGSWKVSHGSTKFTFKPDQLLEKNEVYYIHVSPRVKDKAGIPLQNEKHTHFRVSSE